MCVYLFVCAIFLTQIMQRRETAGMNESNFTWLCTSFFFYIHFEFNFDQYNSYFYFNDTVAIKYIQSTTVRYLRFLLIYTNFNCNIITLSLTVRYLRLV